METDASPFLRLTMQQVSAVMIHAGTRRNGFWMENVWKVEYEIGSWKELVNGVWILTAPTIRRLKNISLRVFDQESVSGGDIVDGALTVAPVEGRLHAPLSIEGRRRCPAHSSTWQAIQLRGHPPATVSKRPEINGPKRQLDDLGRRTTSESR